MTGKQKPHSLSEHYCDTADPSAQAYIDRMNTPEFKARTQKEQKELSTFLTENFDHLGIDNGV